jgi:DNA (cytosine-5)-methyltransferase 1
MTKPRLISLFSGGGGLDYGMEAAGFETRACVEMNHDSCETLRASRPRWPVIEANIHDVDADDVMARAGVKRGEIDLLMGGPPCQPFSKSGYWAKGDSARLDDPRARTLDAYVDMVERTLPRVFLLENVQGLAFRGKDEGFEYFREAIAGVNGRSRNRANYKLRSAVLDAADYGTPQHRSRFVIVGTRDGAPFEFPKPTHGEIEPQTLLPPEVEPYLTAWDALHDVELEDGYDLAMRGKFGDLLPSIPEGQNYLWHTDKGIERALESGLRPPPKALFGWRRHFWTFLLKLAKNKPSWTLQAQPGPSAGPFHWDNRRLSPRELCRLQTMPDNVRVQGTLAEAQRQIGNAVPSLLGEVIGREIATQLLGRKVPKAPLLLPARASVEAPAATHTTVPRKYLDREGKDTAHPGPGLGRGALARAGQLSLLGSGE